MICDPDSTGCFAWYDYDTADKDASLAFYTAVMGWEIKAWSPEYPMFTVGGAALGGFRQLPEQAVLGGCPNSWLPYVSVKDVDVAVLQAVGLGAKLHMGPRDIPGAGRFAVFQDPQGAFVAVFASAGPAVERPHMDTPGQVGWHELATSDMPAAWEFYSALFGWKHSSDMELPPAMGGTYRLFNRRDDNLGGMFQKPQGVPSHWLLYLRVADLDGALATATDKGARLVNGPMEVPGGDRVAQLVDPQGAMFALVASGG